MKKGFKWVPSTVRADGMKLTYKGEEMANYFPSRRAIYAGKTRWNIYLHPGRWDPNRNIFGYTDTPEEAKSIIEEIFL